MIKSEIRSLVKNSVQRFDKVAKFHDRVLDACIELVLHEMLGEVFRMSPLSLQRYARGYGYDTPLAVSSEASSGLYYTTLPVSVYTFPDKASGVRRVATNTQTSIKFYPIDQRESDLLAYGSYANTVKDQIGYMVTSLRVQYYGMTGAVISGGVRMDLLPVFSAYADTDTVLYPEHTTEDGRGFFERIVDRLINKPPVDLKDDNAETKQ
jgi:hypothetical protein